MKDGVAIGIENPYIEASKILKLYEERRRNGIASIKHWNKWSQQFCWWEKAKKDRKEVYPA